jgi:hypothetical protein
MLIVAYLVESRNKKKQLLGNYSEIIYSSNTEIVGWNPTGGMDVCVCVLYAFIVCLHSLR